MPVSPRGTSWQAAVSHKGKRYRRDFATRQEAEIWELQTKADLLAGRSPQEDRSGPKVPTLKEHLEYVSAARWKGKKAEETLLTNGRQVVEILGPSRLVSSLAKPDALAVKQAFQRKGASDSTINRKLAALSVLVREAVELGHLDKGFTVGLTKERQSRIRFLSEDEEAEAIRWCLMTANQDLLDYIIVSLDTGFRQGEVLKITRQDAGKANLWTYDDKAGRNREVPLTRRARETLERRAKATNHDRLFPYHPDWIRARWVKMQYAMGLTHDEGFIPHVLRHTFVTRLLHRGVDIKTVMELAGHTRIETTQRYAQTSPERKTMAIARLMEQHA